MTLNIRRVVTGHDEEGKAVVSRDCVMDNVPVMPSGNSAVLLWVTDDTPSPVEGDEDPALRDLGIAPPAHGSAFRALELMPGKEAFMHRTDTIDYAVVVSGACVMLLDDDAEVEMKAGDVMVQRGTWHGWANRGDAPCRLVFILIGAQPPSSQLHAAL